MSVTTATEPIARHPSRSARPRGPLQCRPVRRILTIALAFTAVAAPSAWARDPIVPLQDVHRGMTCTARTVVQGTTISDFDVEVLDVLADTDGSGPRILVRVSGPAVERTGIAEGFSGSPVYCPGADGAIGNAGAISATIGQYGAGRRARDADRADARAAGRIRPPRRAWRRSCCTRPDRSPRRS